MFRSSLEIKDAAGNELVTSYALLRPDGNWSVMLVNRDENSPHVLRVVFENARQQKAYFSGPVRWVTFGTEQYVWHDMGNNSYAEPDGPAIGRTVAGDSETSYTLPKASVTVLRGRVRD